MASEPDNPDTLPSSAVDEGERTVGDLGDWLRLGVLTAPWGIRGEIKVRLDTDPDFVKRIKRVYLSAQDPAAPRRAVDVQHFFQRGRTYTFKLHGVSSANAAEELRDREVSIPRTEAPSLPEGHFFVDDIIGLRAVTTDNRDLGEVVDVLATGANDVYVVRGAHGEILVPAIRDVVASIDMDARVVRVVPVPGLLSD